MCDEIAVVRVSKDMVGIGDPCKLPKEDWKPPQGTQEEQLQNRIVVLKFRTHSGVVVVFCDPDKVEENKAKPIEYWERIQKNWTNTYERLGLTQNDQSALLELLSKIHWGFSADEIEDMPRDERHTLKSFAELLQNQVGRIFPDARARSYLGGAHSKIKLEEYSEVRREVQRLTDGPNKIGKMEAYKKVGKSRGAGAKLVERICQGEKGRTD